LIALGGYVILSFRAVLAGKRSRLDLRMWLPIIPAVISAIFWFFSAPDPRFAGAAFWILAPWLGIMVLFLLLKSPRRAVVYGTIVVPVGITALIVAGGLQSDFNLDGTGFPSIPVQLTEIYQTASGLQVNVSANPNDSLELWTAPLPASPYELAQLELRDGNMRDGFSMGATPAATKSNAAAGN
ncbi:MAG TPA: hypothetical protein VKQ72_08030, partial [Aggregatilineales bacterium]|nr:hypothetical protein [Aggregatilineales bacterium]